VVCLLWPQLIEWDLQPTKRPLSCQKHYKNIIYAVPTFSNPSGRTMTLARRQQLTRLARKHDALVITDDVYDFLRWNSRSPPPPRLVDIDYMLDGGPISPFGNTVSNASFSKILGPGLRTGWAEATTRFIEGLSQCGSSVSGGAPSQFVASIIAETLQVGSLQSHIHNNLIPALQRRSRIALAAVREFLSPYGVTLESLSSANEKKAMVEGGYFLYLTLPTPLTARTVVSRAQGDGVVVASGDTFEVHGDEQSVPSTRGLRICFAWEDERLLAEGIRQLGEVVVQLLREHGAVDRLGKSPRACLSEF
jgi:DNA-binding transcriptional MocR family regulator